MPPAKKSTEVRQLLAEDHQALDRLFAAVFSALEKDDPLELFSIVDLFWARLAMHIRAENLHLFPAIVKSASRADAAEVLEAIQRLRADHDFFMKALAKAVRMLRSAREQNRTSLKDVQEIVIAVRDRLEVHNSLEEQVVYRLPSKLLTATQQSVLAKRVRRELRNLPPRFEKMAR